MKQIILPLAGVAIFIVFVGLLVKSPNKLGIKTQPTVSPDSGKQELKIDGRTLKVDIANDPQKRADGLSGVTSLTDDGGMLFIFDSQNVNPIFWMKGMLISIDIIWIDNGKIIQIDKDIPAPPPGASDSSLKLYKPPSEVDYVLEVSGGFSDRYGVSVGDSVTF